MTPERIREWSGEPMTLRWLQGNLPWTIAYSESFEAHATPMNRVTHDVLHVMKSLGRVAAECEGHDHGRDRKLYGAALAKEVADLVICALHIARLQGFDLQDAVIDNSSLRNKVNIRALAAPNERAAPQDGTGAYTSPDLESAGSLLAMKRTQVAGATGSDALQVPARAARPYIVGEATTASTTVEWLAVLDYSDNGAVSVNANDIVKSPKVQRQVAATRDLQASPWEMAEAARYISITIGNSTHTRTAQEWLDLARADLRSSAVPKAEGLAETQWPHPERAIENSEAYKTAQEIVAGDRIQVNVRELAMARELLKAAQTIKLQRAALRTRASALSEQPSEPVGYRLIREDVVEFLRGSGTLEGSWYNDPGETHSPPFWWRKYLGPQLKYDKATRSIVPASPSQEQVPQGMVMVPREPTQEQLLAGLECYMVGKSAQAVANIYRAMLAAAAERGAK